MTAIDDRPAVHCGDEVTVHAPGSRYDGYTGFVVEPDEEGGFEVTLPCAELLLHFESGELELTPRLHMTRCAGDLDCVNTAAVPVGGSYLCRACCNHYDHTKRGN